MTDSEIAERRGISIHIAAKDADDARAIFEKAMEMVATGERFEGKLLRANDGGGVATLYTHLRRGMNGA